VTMEPPLSRQRDNVAFIAIGGGSDVSTAEVLWRAMNVSGESVIINALGAKEKDGCFDQNATAIYYASHYAGDFVSLFDEQLPIAIDALKEQKTPKKLEGDALEKALAEIGTSRILSKEQQENFLALAGDNAHHVMQGREGDYIGLIVRSDEAFKEAAAKTLEQFLTVKYGELEWEVVCVDTGGDVLTSDEVEATTDMVMANDGGYRPRQEEDTVDSLILKGMRYCPFGEGFGDLSYMQYGPKISKRDEDSLEIASRLSCSPKSLWVLGLGADGESSERGLEKGIEKYKNAFQGSMNDFAAAMDEVSEYKNPQLNRTPYIIRAAMRGEEHIQFTRGAKDLIRQEGEDRGSGFSGTVPGKYVSKYLVFDSLEITPQDNTNTGGM